MGIAAVRQQQTHNATYCNYCDIHYNFATEEGQQGQKKNRLEKKVHMSAGFYKEEKRQPKLGSKCLDTSLLKEDNS
ncbi:hypothetical protein E2C01_038616 [Portunus trituberculatus]|uniref:Uncharacterized protein n=1 Tax=Portunus trituberculatus TaxID=210409 RepID=A0A5B7FKK1_PORTR|nr:hypothetical protein [Portunus trituberculatus]